MKQPLSKIKLLVKSLPKDDIKYAEKYIKERNFESLLEIIKSDIYLVQRNETSENPKEKFTGINIEDLLELKVEVEEYMSLLEIPNNLYNNDWTYD